MSVINRYNVLRLSNEESNRITRECIETALIQLLEEKSLDRITVTDIVKRAGVSRSAYYRNYCSKEDILNGMLEALVEKICDQMNAQLSAGKWREYWDTLFNSVKKISDLYMTLLKAGLGSTILDGINRATLSQVPADDLRGRYRLLFWNGAIYNILTEWVRSGMQQDPSEMAEICVSLHE